jgi:hypothetical protein
VKESQANKFNWDGFKEDSKLKALLVKIDSGIRKHNSVLVSVDEAIFKRYQRWKPLKQFAIFFTIVVSIFERPAFCYGGDFGIAKYHDIAESGYKYWTC